MIDRSVDTNVFSKIFKGDSAVKSYVESLNASVDATVYIECLQGSKSNREKREIRKYLSNFPLLLITPKISRRAIDLIETYSNSRGLMIADALIAATALENDLTVVTYNVDDFEFIQDLIWQKPPI
jgi:predicted nucleic acid-binding protein